jgi:hypothetical protein
MITPGQTRQTVDRTEPPFRKWHVLVILRNTKGTVLTAPITEPPMSTPMRRTRHTAHGRAKPRGRAPLNKGGRCQTQAHRARVMASAAVRACIRRRPALAATHNKRSTPNHPADRAPKETKNKIKSFYLISKRNSGHARISSSPVHISRLIATRSASHCSLSSPVSLVRVSPAAVTSPPSRPLPSFPWFRSLPLLKSCSVILIRRPWRRRCSDPMTR